MLPYFCPPDFFGIGAYIQTRREIQCLPYEGFSLLKGFIELGFILAECVLHILPNNSLVSEKYEECRKKVGASVADPNLL